MQKNVSAVFATICSFTYKLVDANNAQMKLYVY